MTTINAVNLGLSGSLGSGSFAGATGIQTWTPVPTFSTPGDISISYTSQTGYYNQVGTHVWVDFFLNFTPTYTTSSGSFEITGLPVASSSQLNYRATGVLGTNGIIYPTGVTYNTISAQTGTTFLIIQGFGSGINSMNYGTAQVISGVGYILSGSIIYSA